MFLVLALFVVLYILGAIGLMVIAEKFDEKRGWMAWVPIVNIYLIGKLAYHSGLGWILIGLTFLGGSSSTTVNGEEVTTTLLPQPLFSIVQIALAVIMFLSLHKIYSKLSDKAVIMTVFTILSFGLLAPIFLFAIRKNQLIS